MASRDIEIEMPDGKAAAYLFTPAGKPRAPVLFFMDAMGLRNDLRQMGERLASQGYLVLMPDVFYRSQPYGPFNPTAVFSDPEALRPIGKLNRAFKNDLFEKDTAYYLDAVAKEFGSEAPVGCVGYCMGGRCSLMIAGFHPDRVKAAASFHGGELATTRPDSPHLLAPKMRGKIYIGVAQTDEYFLGEEEARLAMTLRESRVDHTIETFAGTQHGFAVTGIPAFHKEGAERHWERLFSLFGETLG